MPELPWYFPVGHAVQLGTELEPPLLYWPVAHSSHAVEPVDSAS